MPALSQSLTFTVNTSTTTTLTYPNTATTALTYFSNKLKGDGYYGSSDGLHTVQIQTANFVGKIEMQGTLAVSPSSDDWFTVSLGSTNAGVDTTGLLNSSNISFVSYTTATTNVKTYNFTGNLVWVRSKISDFTAGSIIGIKYNH